MRGCFLLSWFFVTAVAAVWAGDVKFEETRLDRQPPEEGPGIRLEYHLLSATGGLSEAASEAVNRSVQKAFCLYTNVVPGSPTTVLKQCEDQFRNEYEGLRRELPDYRHAWEDIRKVSLYYEDTRLLDVTVEWTGYTGGAHHNSVLRHLLFDKSTGRQFSMNELVDPARYPVLTKAIVRALCRKLDVEDETGLKEAGIWVDAVKPMNPFVGEEGLGFFFNNYDITSYAMGRILVVVPWAEIRDLLTPGTPLQGVAGIESTANTRSAPAS